MSEIGTINNLVPKDEMGSFLNKKVIINTSWLDRPMFGTVSEVGQSFVTLTRKDGRIVKIRRSAILGIEEMKEAV